ISLFTILGVQKALEHDTPLIIAVIFGVITATFGGVIRDILCNEIPVIFRKEIYATACILGGLIYFTLQEFMSDTNVVFIIAGLVVIVIRLLAVRFKISLPSLYKD
ncbi:MAG: TRIC cation channel family protein, partial [Psychroserpens sp.]|nr:TRIC cation channel family protein [Psychroserpens sp.]